MYIRIKNLLNIKNDHELIIYNYIINNKNYFYIQINK